jgi:hypothetical protein
MTEKHDKSAEAGGDVEKAIHDAMRVAGWMLPKSPQEIQRAEKALTDQPVRLPDRLADPYAVLARPSKAIRIGTNLPAPQSPSTEQNLAQAAREGGEIPPETQEQMKRDRRAAKGDANG